MRIIVLVLLMWLWGAWGIMLSIGALHNDWWSAMPPISYVATLTYLGIVMIFAIPMYVVRYVIEHA